jgi:membrane-associated phospholipid phosphatase
MPEWGFTDVVQQIVGVNAQRGSASVFVNLYAAIPSMHVGFAVMTGLSMMRFTRRWASRAIWGVYPLAVTFVVISTANHYLTDAVLGAATAAVSALVAKELLARARPHAWAFGRQGVEA